MSSNIGHNSCCTPYHTAHLFLWKYYVWGCACLLTGNNCLCLRAAAKKKAATYESILVAVIFSLIVFPVNHLNPMTLCGPKSQTQNKLCVSYWTLVPFLGPWSKVVLHKGECHLGCSLCVCPSPIDRLLVATALLDIHSWANEPSGIVHSVKQSGCICTSISVKGLMYGLSGSIDKWFPSCFALHQFWLIRLAVSMA